MPTGYTAELCDRDVSFEKFILSCARNFGALIEMRDDPADAPIPQEFQPSKWHRDALAAARGNLDKLEKMSDAEAEAAATKEYEDAIAEDARIASKRIEVRKRLLGMRRRVEEWIPPTKDHDGLKRFMLEQLDMTIEQDGAPWTMHHERKTGEQWRKESIEVERRSIEYHVEENLKEIERTNGRNRWIADLRCSLEQKANKEKQE
jgi:hypothetical protein